MKTAFVALMSLGLCVSFAYGKDQDPARRALAEELLNEMDMKANMEKSFAMFKKMMPAQMQRMKEARKKSEEAPAPGVQEPNEDKAAAAAKMMDEMSKEMSWDNIKDDFITLYAETFTEEELRGLVDFYKSPAGRAFTKKQPELMRRTMELTQKRMFQWMPKIQDMMKPAPKRPKGPETPAVKPPKEGE
jgi:uncharacterized protein